MKPPFSYGFPMVFLHMLSFPLGAAPTQAAPMDAVIRHAHRSLATERLRASGRPRSPGAKDGEGKALVKLLKMDLTKCLL